MGLVSLGGTGRDPGLIIHMSDKLVKGRTTTLHINLILLISQICNVQTVKGELKLIIIILILGVKIYIIFKTYIFVDIQ